MPEKQEVTAARASRKARSERGSSRQRRKPAATTKTKAAAGSETFSATELRAARSQRVRVGEAEPYGWIATSGGDEAESYTLYANPQTHRLVCVCADYIFRGREDINYRCKHIVATLLFIATRYLENEYRPARQQPAREPDDEGAPPPHLLRQPAPGGRETHF